MIVDHQKIICSRFYLIIYDDPVIVMSHFYYNAKRYYSIISIGFTPEAMQNIIEEKLACFRNPEN
jgi:hypothetical protein